ncbi:MAG: T9SS type A sorting domain-containing protein [Chitinophagales bacterium]
MKKNLVVIISFLSAFFSNGVYAQPTPITLLGSFNPTETGSLCGIGYDPGAARVWVYSCSSTNIYSYTPAGVLSTFFAKPGENANDVDVEMAPAQLTLKNITVPEGQLLFVNGESGVADIYAVDNVTGTVTQTLNTAFGSSHVVGGAYHPLRHTFFMVQDNVPSASLENMTAEVDPITDAVLQSFQITSNFSVSFGDLEVGANGNLFVVSSIEDSMAEFTPLGAYVKRHALPIGVTSLSGIAIDCVAGEAWVSSTNGTVYHLGQMPGGSTLSPVITAGGPTTFCKVGSVTLSVNAPGAVSYAWKKGSNFVSGATDQTYEADKSGSFSCLVSNACESVLSNKISVTANPKPEVDFTQAACSGGSVLLTRTGTPTTGVTYKWKLNNDNIGGATNATYTATTSGSYKVEVKITATGCKKVSPSQTVTINCKMGDPGISFTADAYPNPFTNKVTIKTGGNLQQPLNAKLTDYCGRLIREYKSLDPTTLLEINEPLLPGVYFVQLNAGYEVVKTLKIVRTE